MGEEFQASKPIYMQIVDKIISEIVQGKRRPGDKLPSVREMAVNMGVNPNTIQRTYTELERLKLVESRRGQGTFVAANEEVMEELGTEMQEEIIELFIQKMEEIGVSKDQLIGMLQRYLGEGR
ncbi:GntR family transcriptional regulator [Mesobacillus maritimus]|mgnify:CR=1 FL=1|uniref:GntR family transcriptional regulator n=1 Tax=Mesobacillus maritimus TaxID=1643336 RepID=UPI002041EC17|nr:GntR family transcriptional regulator [Mesobacillus maritimus]MCM3586710.1 GntR family transcriptional regulator [Mesobacillus maritimus]MCM3668536.1 GntR family transcriptional regulator [Mesobacillus maritimus]